MVLAKAVDVQTNRLGHLDLGNHVAKPHAMVEHITSRRVGMSLGKAGDPEFHERDNRRRPVGILTRSPGIARGCVSGIRNVRHIAAGSHQLGTFDSVCNES